MTLPAEVTFDRTDDERPFVLHVPGLMVRLTPEHKGGLAASIWQADAEQMCAAEGHAVPSHVASDAAEARAEVGWTCDRCGAELVVTPDGVTVPLGGA